MNPGKPQPAINIIIGNTKATGRTHDAVARPRYHGEEDDEPRPSPPAALWPPSNLRMPREVFGMRNDPQLSDNQCFVCKGYGHFGRDCPYLTAYYASTNEGMSYVTRANAELTDEIRDSVSEYIVALWQVLQYHWPLTYAFELAREVLTEEHPDDWIDDLGDYKEKLELAHELGAPVGWQLQPFDFIFEQLCELRKYLNKPPPERKPPNLEPHDAMSLRPPRKAATTTTGTGRNFPSAFVTTQAGSASTQDQDFQGTPVQQPAAPQAKVKAPSVTVTVTDTPVPKVVSAVVHDAPQVSTATSTTPKASTPVKQEPQDTQPYVEPALTETVMVHQDPGCTVERLIYGTHGYRIRTTYFDPVTHEGIGQSGSPMFHFAQPQADTEEPEQGHCVQPDDQDDDEPMDGTQVKIPSSDSDEL